MRKENTKQNKNKQKKKTEIKKEKLKIYIEILITIYSFIVCLWWKLSRCFTSTTLTNP